MFSCWVFFWTYWETLFTTVRVWCSTPDYGHGFFVPIFAGFLLWQRQEMVDPWPNRGTWWGIPFFAVFALIRWLNLFLNYERDIDSLLPFLFGMTLVLGGWRALRWAWPSIVFLIFMVPLPDFVATALGAEAATLATVMSVYVLQTLGIPAIAMGETWNVIQLSLAENKLEVERACSGLRMLTLFFAICVGASFLLRVPVWKKIVLIISALPIAIVSNVARIVVDGHVVRVGKQRRREFHSRQSGLVDDDLGDVDDLGRDGAVLGPADRSPHRRASFLRRLGRFVAAAKSLGWSGLPWDPGPTNRGVRRGREKVSKGVVRNAMVRTSRRQEFAGGPRQARQGMDVR